MVFIWDIIAVFIIASFALSSYKRGFLNTAIRLAGTIFAIGAALMFSSPVANGIYNSYISEKVLTSISQTMAEVGEPSIEAFTEQVSMMSEQLPAIVSGMTSKYFGDSLETMYESFTTMDLNAFAQMISESIVSPIIVGAIQAIVFCILFGGIMIFVKLLAKMMTTVNYVPLVGSVNALLGGVLGALQGMAYLFVCCAVMWLVMSVTNNSLPFLNQDIIQETVLIKHFFMAGPWMDGIIKGF